MGLIDLSAESVTLRSDGANAQTDQELHCPHTSEDPFSHGVSHTYMISVLDHQYPVIKHRRPDTYKGPLLMQDIDHGVSYLRSHALQRKCRWSSKAILITAYMYGHCSYRLSCTSAQSGLRDSMSIIL